mmetsp:Transcript_34191/g.107820  ORF Transcript_34191/g.107820 Transcript_34191/m.107820 type:complete len:223 (-) Transcript_34191:410-1078(-)
MGRSPTLRHYTSTLGKVDDHEPQNDDGQPQQEDDPYLARVFCLQELGQLSHHEPHLLGGAVQVRLEVIEHAVLVHELLVDAVGHEPHPVDALAQLHERLVLLPQRELRARLLVVDVVRVGHLHLVHRPQRPRGSQYAQRLLLVPLELLLDIPALDVPRHAVDARRRVRDEFLAAPQLRVVDVLKLVALALHGPHRHLQIIELPRRMLQLPLELLDDPPEVSR